VSNYTIHSIIYYVILNSSPPQMQIWPPRWPPQTAAARNAPVNWDYSVVLVFAHS